MAFECTVDDAGKLVERDRGASLAAVAAAPFLALACDLGVQICFGDALGTDGFGISDTRRAARRFFHVDAESTAVRVLQGLVYDGKLDHGVIQQAIDKYELFDYAIDAAPRLEN